VISDSTYRNVKVNTNIKSCTYAQYALKKKTKPIQNRRLYSVRVAQDPLEKKSEEYKRLCGKKYSVRFLANCNDYCDPDYVKA